MITLLFSPLDPGDLALDGLEVVGPVETTGLLMDCHGFPVHQLGHPGPVKGHLHRIREEDRDMVLNALDLQHDVMPSGIRRTITIIDGKPAWAYHWTNLTDMPVVVGGDWTAHRDARLL